MVEPNHEPASGSVPRRGPKPPSQSVGSEPPSPRAATFFASVLESAGGTEPPPPPGPPPPSGTGGDLVDMLTKAVLPLLSSGRTPKWLPIVLGGACVGAGVAYLVARDTDRPGLMPRGE